jgi:dihydrofolate synthase/folylpolyglutamate synthase
MTDWQFSSLGDSLAWLDRHVNLEAIERGVAGPAAAPTLDRIRALLDAMSEPQRDYPIVHITGTNGKGSTTRLTTALLQANGLSVGTITSPHLESINERIARDGVPISDPELAETLDALRALEGFLLDQSPGAIPPTWFELMTAAGYRYFSDVAVEAAVVEVGLGGRYDATNAADGLVAVVTNVELDHTEILGPTRELIAGEKAGIIKADATAVIGETDLEIVQIFEREADEVGALAFWRRGFDFDCVASQIAHGGRLLDLRTPGRDYDGVYLPLFGAHQGLNASAALVAAEAFFGEPLAVDVVEEAFAAVTVPGRLEVVGRRPLVVLDGAHNAAGAISLGQALREDFAARARTIVVMGCLQGRAPLELLEGIGPDQISEVIACRPDSLRAQPGEAVAAAAALTVAFEVAEADDLVVITGSLYVVGAARHVVARLGSTQP